MRFAFSSVLPLSVALRSLRLSCFKPILITNSIYSRNFRSNHRSSMSSDNNSDPIAANRGAFILFEGIDRCGKTTQCGLLTSHLQASILSATEPKNLKTEAIRFPNRTSTIGMLINDYLTNTKSTIDDHTIHLLFSANRWEQSSEIEKKLNSGINLVCDRYAYSGVAFSSAKGIDMDWCKACDKGLPAPDVIIYLDIPVEEAAQRGQFGEERYEKIDFQIKVRQQFMCLKEEDEAAQLATTTTTTTGDIAVTNRNTDTDTVMKKSKIMTASNGIPWHVLDARKSIQILQEEIKSIAESTIQRVQHTPIQKMWI